MQSRQQPSLILVDLDVSPPDSQRERESRPPNIIHFAPALGKHQAESEAFSRRSRVYTRLND